MLHYRLIRRWIAGQILQTMSLNLRSFLAILCADQLG
jgi:hypothetical protein